MTDAFDRPVWSMLTGPMAPLSVAQGAAVRIDPGYGPFAAARDTSPEAQAALARAAASAGGEVWVVESEEWAAPPGMQVLRTAPLVQMVAENSGTGELEDAAVEALGDGDVAEMTALALATEPGPWGPLTHRYGQFFGIRAEGKLAAMAGVRMQPSPALREVSAVCTWPSFRGRGYAKRLIRRVMADMAGRGETPFLHSYAGNSGAIALYERLGFRTRRTMIVTVLAAA